ncbi:hypothetical protein ZTR_09047 [Talaromyces verruculosus]|nr:hypothetical protein ZTR_09047 [Talaromyces verruculosus]
MLWCVSDLERFAEQCYSSLSPHGYVELSQGNLIPSVEEEDLLGFAKWKTEILRAGRKLEIPVDISPGDVVRAFQNENLYATYTVHVLPIKPHEEHFKVFEATFRKVSLRLLTLGGTSPSQATLDIANAMTELKRSKTIKWELFTVQARKSPPYP